MNQSSTIIASRKYNHIEVQCILHTLCNLNCKFCFETKEKGIREYTKINIDYIRNLPNEIIKVIKPIMLENPIELVEISTMGGEMFFDNIHDDVFDEYGNFAKDLNDKVKEILPNVKCEFKVLSNGVYTKRERVAKFLKDNNFSLVLSYDPIDRFNNNKQKEIWLDTFNYFRNLGIYVWIATVLTKKSINAYIKGDEIFNKTGNDVFVESLIYVPRLDYHDYLPNDDDLYNYFKWAIDNEKFNITHVFKIMRCRAYNKFIPTCAHYRSDHMFGEAFTNMYNNNHINKCTEESPIPKDDYYGKYSNQIEDVNNCAKYKQPIGLQKRGCLYCEYYSYCPKMCWTQILFKEYKITQCPIKRIYQYIDKDNTIIDRFKEWEKCHE